jgi:TPR repeat protein
MNWFVPPLLTSLVLLAAPAAAAPAATDAAAAESCDRLAAFDDGSAGAPPVPFREIEARPALSACRAAVTGSAPAPRHHLQLARALLRLDRPAEALRHLRIAAKSAHAPAWFVLGQLYHSGTGVAEDKDRAFRLYRRSLEGGYAGAAVGLILLHEDPASGHYDPARARAARRVLGARD